VRASHAFLLAASIGLLAAAVSCNWNEPTLFVHVHAEQDSLSQCFLVVATDEDGGHGQSTAHAVSAGQTLSVGVYQGGLGERVVLEAQGFTSPGCADPVDERSDQVSAAFASGSTPQRDLTLRGEGSCSDGVDGDGDGKIDCSDTACAASSSCADGGTNTGPFPYAPSNFSPGALPVPDAGLIIDCDAGYDTGTRTGFLCGSPQPPSYVLDGGSAGPMVLVAVSSLTITPVGRWRITGPNPLIVAVFGDAGLYGPLLGGGFGASDGPGVRRIGCPGSGESGQDGGNGGGGGGGGGYGRKGGEGSRSAGTQAPGGNGGAAFGNPELVPLRGGCPGAQGGVWTPGLTPPLLGGGAGGAIQVSAAGALHVTSAVGVPGGGGLGDVGSSNNGGAGGGSGGAILLEGNRLSFAGTARVTANGGAGSEGCDGTACNPGEDGRMDGPFPAKGGAGHSFIPGGDGGAGTIDATGGTDAGGSNFGGGGGGGAVGRIRLNAALGCSFESSPDMVISPPATSNQRGDAGCP